MLHKIKLKPTVRVIAMQIPFSQLYEQVQEILKNKVEEIHYFGYGSITEQDVWCYCIDKVWRKQDVQKLRLHELASGILGVSASEMLNYIQIKGLKHSNMQQMLSKDELAELFDPKK